MAPLGSDEFDGTERFDVLDCLGRGAMGTVYRVRDRESGGELALKVLDARGPESLQRFKNEFRSVQALRHPGLVALGELGESAGQWFYTMELVRGTELSTALLLDDAVAGDDAPADEETRPGGISEPIRPHQLRSSRPRFDEPRLREVLVQLVRAIDSLHRAGKIHRDIKPSNIIIDEGGRAVLLDFGLVLDRLQGERLTGTGVVVGTGAYMAPEQASSTQADEGPAADWYALGVVLYEVLCGRLPHEGATLEIVMRKQREDPLPPSVFAGGVPRDLEALCMAMLQRDPRKRPDAAEILARLEADAPRDVTPRAAVTSESDTPTGTAPFVGREDVLARLIEASRDLDGPSTLILQGASGVGKTALVEQFEQLLVDEAPEALFMRGRCYERESVPFKGIDGVIESLAAWLRRFPDDFVQGLLPTEISLLPMVFPALRRVRLIAAMVPRDTFGWSHRELRDRVLGVLAELLARIAEERPVVLQIDDVQWASHDTWAVLETLVEAPAAPRILLLLTRRRPDGDDPAAALRAEVIDVPILPPAAARELARELLLQHGGDPALAPGIAADAGGHPMFIAQLVRHLAGAEATSDVGGLDELLTAELERLPPGDRAVADIACVSGGALTQRSVALASGQLLGDLLTTIAPRLQRANLIRTAGGRASDRLEPFHDRVRVCGLALLSVEERRELHGRIADALDETGEADQHPIASVQHLIDAGRLDRAAHRALAGASTAKARLAFDRAAQLYRTAIALRVLEPARERQAAESLASTLVTAGRGAEAAELYLRLSEEVRGFKRLVYRRRAAEQLLFSGHLRRGLETLDALLADLGEKLPESPRAALWSVVVERARLRLRGLGWRPVETADLAPRQLEMLELYGAIAIGLSLVDNLRAASYSARHARLSLQLGDPDRVARGLAVEVVFSASRGMVRRARRIAAIVRGIARESTDAHTQAYACFAEGGVEYFLDNDWAASLHIMERAEQHMADGLQTTGWESDSARSYQAFCLLYQGRLRELSTRVDRFVRRANQNGSVYGVVNLQTRLVLLPIAAGRGDEASEALDEVLARWLPWDERFLVQHFYALHSRLELSLATSTPLEGLRHLQEQSAALAKSHLLGVPIVRAELEFAAARVHLAAAGQGDRGQHLARARVHARRLRRCKLPAAHTWSLLLTASLQQMAGDPRAAASLQVARDALTRRGDHLFGSASGAALRDVDPTAAGDFDTWVRDEGVADPAALCRVLVPGWNH